MSKKNKGGKATTVAPAAKAPVVNDSKSQKPADSQPKPAEKEVKAGAKTPKTPKAPEVIDNTTVQFPTSVSQLRTMNVRDLTQLSDVIIRRYQEHPVEGTSDALKQMYVGPNGLVDVFIAEAAARAIMDGSNVIIKGLPEDRKNAIVKALAFNGITIADPKLLEAPINEKTPGVIIEPEAKEQHKKDVANEKKVEKEDIKNPQNEEQLTSVLQKIFFENRKENQPIIGLCKCVAALNDYDKARAKDDAAKQAVSSRSYKDTLTRLFTIMPSNLLLFSIGRAIAEKIKEVGNPISAFYYVQQAAYVKDTTGKTKGYLLTDVQVATLTQMFVTMLLNHFDEITTTKLKTLDPTKDEDKKEIERLKNSIKSHHDLCNCVTNCSKSSIDDIKDYSDEIKNTDTKTFTSDEQKAAFGRKIALNAAWFGIRSLCDFTDVPEKDRPGIIRDHMIYILNLFRPFDNQLSLDGKYASTVVESKVETADTAKK